MSLDRLTETQRTMEARYRMPYNWLHAPHSIRWAHKEGLSRIVRKWIRAQDRLLDVGCGDAWYTARFADTGATVTGIDVSERAIGFAKIICPKATFVVGSADHLPFPDGSFDVVTCIQVIEHLTEETGQNALQEFRRVLRPGGLMIISVPSTLRPLSTAHLRHYTPGSIRAFVEPYGTIESISGHEQHSRVLTVIRKLFENRIWSLPFAAKWFYEKIYFPRWNACPIQKANNLVVCVRTTS